jgi:hypothetical protein
LFAYSENEQTLSSANLSLKLFDKVVVQISVNQAKRKLQLLCVSPALHKLSAPELSPQLKRSEVSSGTPSQDAVMSKKKQRSK